MMSNKYDYKFVGISSQAYDFKDKERHIAEYIGYMLSRTQMVFKWVNLPDTIPERMLELYLQTNGSCIIGRANDEKLYALIGGYGGEPNAYYQPTNYVVANPYLKLNKTYHIDDDCVLIRNDGMLMGLMPMFLKYTTALVENDLSMQLIDINTRISSLISASDDRTKLSAEIYLENIAKGDMGIIAESALLESIKTQPYANSNNNIKNLIEYHQYLKASWYNEIGLNANFNMKREAINGEEAGLNEQALIPLIDDMLRERQEACEKINAMFGTNISVQLASAWEDVHELVNEDDTLDNEDETTDNEEVLVDEV